MNAPDIVAAGDAVLVAEFENRIDPGVNARVVGMADALRSLALPGVRDIVPTFRSVAVYFDPLTADVDRLTSSMRAAGAVASHPTAVRRTIDIPVCYDTEFAPDLGDVARFAGLSEEQAIARHVDRGYRVFMLGFLPGFAYLGIVDERIAAPRRPTPRRRVPAGAVAIAGAQTGVYPTSAPGGWNIIGRTPMSMLEPGGHRPAVLQAGDAVRFQRVDRPTFERLLQAGEPDR